MLDVTSMLLILLDNSEMLRNAFFLMATSMMLCLLLPHIHFMIELKNVILCLPAQYGTFVGFLCVSGASLGIRHQF